MSNFLQKNLEQYRQIFGHEKMCLLWEEFINDANDKLKCIEKQSLEKQRLAYHSLRSSSLVFGMEEFAELCRLYEEEILSGILIDDKKAAKSRNILEQGIKEVKACLGKGENHGK